MPAEEKPWSPFDVSGPEDPTLTVHLVVADLKGEGDEVVYAAYTDRSRAVDHMRAIETHAGIESSGLAISESFDEESDLYRFVEIRDVKVRTGPATVL